MNKLRAAVQRIPLSLKVVSLYIFVGIPLYALLFAAPAPTVATNDYLSDLVLAEQANPVTPDTISGSPNRLVIERLGIDLSIEDGAYDVATDSWTLSRTGTHYALMTAPPNTTAGNTLIYGHNNRRILGPTRGIQPGDVLEVYTKEGYIFRYAYTADVKVDPTDTSILSDTAGDKPKLTLLTCDGLWNEKRRLMSFDFLEVSMP